MKGSLLFLCLFASSCAAIPDAPKPPVAETFTLPGSYQEVWRAALMTLLTEYIPVEKQDETRGVITSGEFQIQKNEYSEWAEGAFLAPHGFGKLELLVVPADTTKTKLQIAAQFRGEKQGLVGTKGRHHQSSGKFEKRLAARVHTQVVIKKYPKLLQLVIGCNFRWNETIQHYEVVGVEQGSFGEEQGFQNGDVVVEIDGMNMTMDNFFNVLTAIEKSETKTFFVDRRGAGTFVEARIFYLPNNLPWHGFQVQHDLASGTFRVSEVIPGSPAQIADVRVGDVLLQEEDISIANWNAYYRAMTSPQLGSARRFLVLREGKQQWLTITRVQQEGF